MKRFVSVGLAIVLFIPPSPPLGHIAMFDEINQPIAMPPKQHEWTVERKKNRKKRREE